MAATPPPAGPPTPPGVEPRPGHQAGHGREPAVAWPCRSLWRSRHRPEDPDRFLAGLRQEARRVKERGAGALEFHADACGLDARYAEPGPWREAAAILAAEGLGASVHLPYVWPDLTSLDQPVWEGSVASVLGALRATAALAPQLAAVHPANYATQALVLATPAAERPALLEELAARLVTALHRLQAEAPPEAAGALALENLEGMPWPLFVRVVRAAGVAVCLDAGHAVSNGDDPVSMVREVGDRLRGIHLHDALPPGPAAGAWVGAAAPAAGVTGRAHLPLGSGRLALDQLAAALRQRGFAGPVVLELDDDGALPEATRLFREAWQSAAPGATRT